MIALLDLIRRLGIGDQVDENALIRVDAGTSQIRNADDLHVGHLRYGHLLTKEGFYCSKPCRFTFLIADHGFQNHPVHDDLPCVFRQLAISQIADAQLLVI